MLSLTLKQSGAKNIDEIVEVAKLLSHEEPFIKGTKTFKVRKRFSSDKGFELNSYELSSKLSGDILVKDIPS